MAFEILEIKIGTYFKKYSMPRKVFEYFTTLSSCL